MIAYDTPPWGPTSAQQGQWLVPPSPGFGPGSRRTRCSRRRFHAATWSASWAAQLMRIARCQFRGSAPLHHAASARRCPKVLPAACCQGIELLPRSDWGGMRLYDLQRMVFGTECPIASRPARSPQRVYTVRLMLLRTSTCCQWHQLSTVGRQRRSRPYVVQRIVVGTTSTC